MTHQKYGLVRDATTLFERTVEKSTQKRDTPYVRLIPFSLSELALEEWQSIPGYESQWQVSSLGRIRNTERLSKYQKPTKPSLATRLGRDGYERFTSSFFDATVKRWTVNIRVHRAVVLAFHPNAENRPVVNHKDGNKLNNKADNLEWVTYKENSQHAIQTGLVSTDSLRKLHTHSSRANQAKRNSSIPQLFSSHE